METLEYLALVKGREQWVFVRHLVGDVLIKTEVLEDRPAQFENFELNGITYRAGVIFGVGKGEMSDRGSLIQPQADVYYVPLEAK